MPGQTLRKKSVRQKLNPMRMEFMGKNVLIVDGWTLNFLLISVPCRFHRPRHHLS